MLGGHPRPSALTSILAIAFIANDPPKSRRGMPAPVSCVVTDEDGETAVVALADSEHAFRAHAASLQGRFERRITAQSIAHRIEGVLELGPDVGQHAGDLGCLRIKIDRYDSDFIGHRTGELGEALNV